MTSMRTRRRTWNYERQRLPNRTLLSEEAVRLLAGSMVAPQPNQHRQSNGLAVFCYMPSRSECKRRSTPPGHLVRNRRGLPASAWPRRSSRKLSAAVVQPNRVPGRDVTDGRSPPSREEPRGQPAVSVVPCCTPATIGSNSLQYWPHRSDHGHFARDLG